MDRARGPSPPWRLKPAFEDRQATGRPLPRVLAKQAREATTRPWRRQFTLRGSVSEPFRRVGRSPGEACRGWGARRPPAALGRDSRSSLTWSITRYGLGTAASTRVGRGQRGAFRGRVVHGAAGGGRHSGVAGDAPRRQVTDLADSSHPRGWPDGHYGNRPVVEPIPESCPVACWDRLTGDPGDGDDLRHRLGAGARHRPGPRGSGNAGGGRVVLRACDPGMDLVVFGRW